MTEPTPTQKLIRRARELVEEPERFDCEAILRDMYQILPELADALEKSEAGVERLKAAIIAAGVAPALAEGIAKG